MSILRQGEAEKLLIENLYDFLGDAQRTIYLFCEGFNLAIKIMGAGNIGEFQKTKQSLNRLQQLIGCFSISCEGDNEPVLISWKSKNETKKDFSNKIARSTKLFVCSLLSFQQEVREEVTYLRAVDAEFAFLYAKIQASLDKIIQGYLEA